MVDGTGEVFFMPRSPLLLATTVVPLFNMCKCLLGDARWTVLCRFKCRVFSLTLAPWWCLGTDSTTEWLFCRLFLVNLWFCFLAPVCGRNCCCSGMAVLLWKLAATPLPCEWLLWLPRVLAPCSLTLSILLSVLWRCGSKLECLHIELFTCSLRPWPLPLAWGPSGSGRQSPNHWTSFVQHGDEAKLQHDLHIKRQYIAQSHPQHTLWKQDTQRW